MDGKIKQASDFSIEVRSARKQLHNVDKYDARTQYAAKQLFK